MASFTNLSYRWRSSAEVTEQPLSLTREVKDAATGAVQVPADYSQLGTLLIVQTLLGLALPFSAILLAKVFRLRTA